jgi:hypothetical protein
LLLTWQRVFKSHLVCCSSGRCSIGYSYIKHDHLLRSLCPGAIFSSPPIHDLANPRYRKVCLSGNGNWLVTMPWYLWDKFLEKAPFNEPPVCIVPPVDGASFKTTHQGNTTPNVTIAAFVRVCKAAKILPKNLDFGRAGPGCGPVPLQPAPLDTTCVLGAAELGLGSLNTLLRYPVLCALNSIFDNSRDCAGTIVIVDLK